MATAPQTTGYSLVDSPVGLLAWILEEFFEWSDTVDSPFETNAPLKRRRECCQYLDDLAHASWMQTHAYESPD
ncbi:hypothetical protein [Microbacterium sp. HMWF026]|uniref:hypothetical protein n=1 Tax=Microbacterium sp. HMWF026 TaxID=2056861 RepID=UPI002159FCE7|nr:hypothetical protein [Microbacterium sp. HMWF026]